METEPPTSESSPLKAVDFALPLFLLMPTADFAAIHGEHSAALHIWGAEVVKLSPVLMVAVAVFAPLLLAASRWARWRRGITTVLVFMCVFSAPALLAVGSSAIPLSRGLRKQEVADLRQAFDIPTVPYASSGAGRCLRVRRSDDTAELRRHLLLLGVLRAEDEAR